MPVPNLLSLNQEHHSKKLFFLVKSLQNWGYDTSLIDMLELPNFAYMTTFTMLFEPCDKLYFITTS